MQVALGMCIFARRKFSKLCWYQLPSSATLTFQNCQILLCLSASGLPQAAGRSHRLLLSIPPAELLRKPGRDPAILVSYSPEKTANVSDIPHLKKTSWTPYFSFPDELRSFWKFVHLGKFIKGSQPKLGLKNSVNFCKYSHVWTLPEEGSWLCKLRVTCTFCSCRTFCWKSLLMPKVVSKHRHHIVINISFLQYCHWNAHTNFLVHCFDTLSRNWQQSSTQTLIACIILLEYTFRFQHWCGNWKLAGKSLALCVSLTCLFCHYNS